MKKEIICKECNTVTETYSICDICGEKLFLYPIHEIGEINICDIKGNPIEVNIEGEIYHFCSLKHLSEFVLNEISKENPRKDITFGNKKGDKK